MQPTAPDLYASGRERGMEELLALFQLLEMRGKIAERTDPLTCRIPELIVQWLLERLELSSPGNYPTVRDTFTMLKAAIDRNFQGDVSRKSLAYEFSLSPDYITRLFKRYAGVGVTEYLTRRRMELAGSLLAAEHRPSVAAIAESCGYPNADYFAKVFRRYWGKLPRAVRKKNS